MRGVVGGVVVGDGGVGGGGTTVSRGEEGGDVAAIDDAISGAGPEVVTGAGLAGGGGGTGGAWGATTTTGGGRGRAGGGAPRLNRNGDDRNGGRQHGVDGERNGHIDAFKGKREGIDDAGRFLRLFVGERAFEDGGFGLDGGQNGKAGNVGHAIAAAAADAILAVGEDEFAFADGDFAGGPEDLIADAVGDVIAFVVDLAHGAHLVRVEAFVMGADDWIFLDILAHFGGRIHATGNDGVLVVGSLYVEGKGGQSRFRFQFLGDGGRPLGFHTVTSGAGQEEQDEE